MDRSEYLKQWHLKNRERRLQARREKYLRNREKELLTAKRWQQANRVKTRAYQKKHRSTPEYAVYNRIRRHERRALEKHASVNRKAIAAWVKRVKSFKAVFCYWCNNPVRSKDIEIDHIIALNRGGPHSIENLCVSCSGCNRHKSDFHVSEWNKAGQQVFPI